MVHTDSTYQRYVTDQENEMTRTAQRPTPHEDTVVAEAARRMAAASRPLGLGA